MAQPQPTSPLVPAMLNASPRWPGGRLRAELRSGSLGWLALAAGGLIASLAGLTGSSVGVPEGSGSTRLVLRVPDPLVALVLLSLALAVVLLLALLLPRGLRRRKREEEEYEQVHELPKAPAWLALVLWALVLLPFAAAGYLVWNGALSIPAELASHQRFSASQPPRLEPRAEAPAVLAPLYSKAVAALAVAAGLGALALAFWILFGDRLAWWWAGPVPADRSAPLIEAVEESLEHLRLEPDARRAVIKCYQRFEQVLARSKLPRAPWQTPVEFMREALRRLPLPVGAVEDLTRLFQISRFSHEPVGAVERDGAYDALVQIRAALERRNLDAAAV
jgi:hypothetical protein